ncbi:hypothetical protein ACFL6N_01015 [Thermodesulfobacteriota bacterium]
MAQCAYCGTTIIFGGKKEGDFCFCNDKCLENGVVIVVAQELPREAVEEAIIEVHQGWCPQCGGPGPVDVHMSHTVYSLLLITNWSSTPNIYCRGCGRKSQARALVFSLFLGWWGFPWGFIFSPIQVVKNVIGILGGPKAGEPSGELEHMVRMMIAADAIENNQAEETSDVPEQQQLFTPGE